MKRIFALLALAILTGWTVPVWAAGATSSSGTIVLGSKSYRAPSGSGWGKVKPAKIFNGGDPSGLVWKIRWQHWGQPTAIGWGSTYIPRPTGNYYPAVQAELRATDIGRCSAGGPLAYRRLSIRVPSRPGGALRPWTAWSLTGNIC
jgi:hypothetical protein